MEPQRRWLRRYLLSRGMQIGALPQPSWKRQAAATIAAETRQGAVLSLGPLLHFSLSLLPLTQRSDQVGIFRLQIVLALTVVVHRQI
jgi:hypothetical protein